LESYPKVSFYEKADTFRDYEVAGIHNSQPADL
jgi:hypothetical protein